MKWSSAATRVAAMLVVGSGALIVGCNRIAGHQSRPDPRNDLPAGVVRNPETFRRSLQGFAPVNPHERDRPADCFLGLCRRVKVTIEAMGNTLNISPNNPPPAGSGIPVAHLVNADRKKVEKYYGLKPSATAEYYLWVTAKTPTQAQWTLVEVPMGSGQVNAALPTELSLCHRRGPTDAKTSDADFAEQKHDGKCDARTLGAASSSKTSSMLSVRPLVMAVQEAMGLLFAAAQGGWIECSMGCCT